MKLLVTLLMVLQLIACGGGGGGGDDTAAAVSNVVVSGSVGDGPITGATVRIYNSSGQQIAAVTSDSKASYTSTIASDAEYPLLFKVADGVDLVTGSAPDFEMVSVMMTPVNTHVNINPLSTLMVKMAQLLPGGMTAANINTAKGVVTNVLGFGLDPAIIGDPISTPVTASNVANIVKASEALGEMVRRTRDLIASTGATVSGDAIISALASDLTDGYLDGAGHAGANPTVAAVANVVSGQVLVEALSNNLKVGGTVATGVIDQAIRTTHPQVSSSQLTGSVRITSGMLAQTQLALATARVLDASVQLVNIENTLGTLTPDSLPGIIATVLPADSSSLLDNAVVLSATASNTEMDAIAQLVYAGSGTSVNNSPVITGSAAASVLVNTNYAFQPTATDTDGDPLAFSIVNKPAWAGFNTASGRLSGTPTSADVGLYNNIVISVSDGKGTASLGAFSIQVSAAAVQISDFSLNWTAPVARADGSPLSLADIDGYRIYYGTSAGNYSTSVDITDGSRTSVTVTGVPAGSYHVVMTTYDTSGVESVYSPEVLKTVQ